VNNKRKISKKSRRDGKGKQKILIQLQKHHRKKGKIEKTKNNTSRKEKNVC
jgi:hypothetical protein